MAEPQGQKVVIDQSNRILPQLLNPIDNPQDYIDDDKYLAQEKFNGERRVVEHDDSYKTKGYNKKGKEVQLPGSIVKSINNTCLLDSEIISEKLYVFDLLFIKGKSIREFPCIDRINELNRMTFGNAVEVVETAYTKEQKQRLYDKLVKNNAEGIVFKLKSSPYTAGRPNSLGSQLKCKFYHTATFIVCNTTKGKRSVGLSLLEGEVKDNVRIFMGKCTIPPNHDVPSVNDLIEVRYLYCHKGGAVYQPTYLGKRTDSDLSDATMKQIVYKAEGEQN